MSEHHTLLDSGILITLWNINDHYVVGVNVYGLIADHQLFHLVSGVSQHIDICVSNIELVFVLDIELGLERILFLDGEDKEA